VLVDGICNAQEYSGGEWWMTINRLEVVERLLEAHVKEERRRHEIDAIIESLEESKWTQAWDSINVALDLIGFPKEGAKIRTLRDGDPITEGVYLDFEGKESEFSRELWIEEALRFVDEDDSIRVNAYIRWVWEQLELFKQNYEFA
jgi:hypothetical protein